MPVVTGPFRWACVTVGMVGALLAGGVLHPYGWTLAIPPILRRTAAPELQQV